MKVFWSWQSDTPGRTGRHLVRDALADAIAALQEPNEIEDADRPEGFETLHLDHDNKGLAGSPDLAPAIMKKIRDAAVFVADVTLVGRAIEGTSDPDKRFINSNVAIEYGFAAGVLRDERILMVQNTFYGDRSKLPFDLAGKVGPLQFHLAPDDAKEEREKTKGMLVTELKARLKAVFATIAHEPQRAEPPVERTPSIGIPAFFFPLGQPLGRFSPRPGLVAERDIAFDSTRATYIRFMPKTALPEPLTAARTFEVAQNHRLGLLDHNIIGGHATRNRYGGMFFENGDDMTARALSQLFRTGEMWAVSSTYFLGDGDGNEFLDLGPLRNGLVRTLHSFQQVYLKELGGTSDGDVELGAVGLEGIYCHEGNGHYRGPYMLAEVTGAFVLGANEGEAVIDLRINDFVARLAAEAGPEIDR